MTLTKVDYKNLVLKISLKAQAKINAFLKLLPFFSTWPAKWLTRIQFDLHPVKLIRNQEVYREGELANNVYLI